MKLKLIIILLFLHVISFADKNDFLNFFAKIGINLGGTMPLPVPANISKVKNYDSNLLPNIELETMKKINKNMGISVGISSDNKGMSSTTEVKEYSMHFGDFKGRFTGMVETEMSFNYLEFPVLFHYSLTEKLSAYTGVHYAYLLNGKFKGEARDGKLNNGNGIVNIESGEKYDFSKELKNYDFGLNIGLNYLPYNKHLLLSLNFNYGLVSIFPDDFNGIKDEMQHVYGRFSIGRKF